MIDNTYLKNENREYEVANANIEKSIEAEKVKIDNEIEKLKADLVKFTNIKKDEIRINNDEIKFNNKQISMIDKMNKEREARKKDSSDSEQN